MKTAIVNIGHLFTGDLDAPSRPADTVLTDGGVITRVGTASTAEVEACDVVIDAAGATLAPGLIDSHVHITFGDYTPRQRTVGFLESYLHGGVTTSMQAIAASRSASARDQATWLRIRARRPSSP